MMTIQFLGATGTVTGLNRRRTTRCAAIQEELRWPGAIPDYPERAVLE